MNQDPNPKSRNRGDDDPDIERGTDIGKRVPQRDGDTARTVGPEDEDRRVRPGEKRPHGTMP